VTHVNDISKENNKNFESLKKEMEKFNVHVGNEKQKVLAVDDDATTLTMIEGMLKNDYEVFTAKSGKEALGLFFQGLVPQLVLLDLLMPEMDGWDTYSRIRAISGLHDIPIAIFTASEDPKDLQRANDMGAIDYIKKPIKKDDMLQRVGCILQE
jgi:putative two-component system response regulator